MSRLFVPPAHSTRALGQKEQAEEEEEGKKKKKCEQLERTKRRRGFNHHTLAQTTLGAGARLSSRAVARSQHGANGGVFAC